MTAMPRRLAVTGSLLWILAFAPSRLAWGGDGLNDLRPYASDTADHSQQRGSIAGTRRLPVPPTDALSRSAKKVNEIFGSDVKRATSPDAKSKLAAALLGQADESEDPTARYVLLESARKLAVECGHANTALRAIDQISETYAVDGVATKQAAMESLAAKAPIATLGKVIDMLLILAATAVDKGDVEAAENLKQSAASDARRSKDRDRQKAAIDSLAGIK